MRAIKIEIDSLVLSGDAMPEQNAARIAEATTQALAARLASDLQATEATGASDWQAGEQAEILLPPITLSPGAGEHEIAQELASALHRALGERRVSDGVRREN